MEAKYKFPLPEHLVTPPYAEKYREGTYEIDSLTLHVNRGLGTTRLPYRFLSRPELTVYEFKPKNDKKRTQGKTARLINKTCATKTTCSIIICNVFL